MNPSIFNEYPWGSMLQNHQSEVVAQHIMDILARSGDVFRDLAWDEYIVWRLKDGNFSEFEKQYFDNVIYLAKGEKTQVLNFSKTWKDLYINSLEKKQTSKK